MSRRNSPVPTRSPAFGSAGFAHALRAGEPAHRIAAHADLRSLQSVARHEQRENLLRHNVAGQLGL